MTASDTDRRDPEGPDTQPGDDTPDAGRDAGAPDTQTVDGWALGQEARRIAAARQAGDPSVAAMERRLADATARFGRNPTSIDALLDEVDRRAAIDLDAPLESRHPAIEKLKLGVRKSTAFVARHLARQVEVLVVALAAVLRQLDARLAGTEAAADPVDLGGAATSATARQLPSAVVDRLIDPLRAASPPPARVIDDPAAVATLPPASTGLVVLAGLTDPLLPGAKVALARAALPALAEGASLAVAGRLPEQWEDAVGHVAADLSPGRPFHPDTWAAVLGELGLDDVATRIDDAGGCHVTWARRREGGRDA